MEDSKTLTAGLERGDYDEKLKEIYLDESVLEYQKKRYIQALNRYEVLFGGGKVSIYSAPGRSEVGGNHTDHQRGMVLAASINLDAVAVAGKNQENCVKVVSDGYEMSVVPLDDLEKKKEEAGTSAGLIRGVLAGLRSRGYLLGGCSLYVTSDVLIGAGLSSSAAFETILGTVISGLFNDMKVGAVEIAQIGQFAENVYFEKPCGLMDQTACSVGGMIHIDFQEPKQPVVRKLNVDLEQYAYSLCIVDTKGSHEDLTDDYAQIPLEMKAAAAYFGKEVLRNVEEKDLYLHMADMRKELGDRPVLRAIHFFEENKRVEKQAKALEDGRFESFLRLVKESGNSSFQYLQNVYTNHDVQNQSMSVGLAVSESVLGDHGVCRVHGGGFAGTIQAFVENDFVGEYKEAVERLFGDGACHVLKVRKYGGIKVL
ncbi:galactokinase [Ruminococcus gauvreauii]|uniref:Galactokinase n=1 Tax=Ruminococcus gauvreauii TaxID=438033 RepID=A0ABY5VDF1_9FIRM|nr:galactokinase family protein [Ruminococcus gauvreauii]UWP58252.1 galactokinase [Ruminococcus gauvreauii]